MATVIRNPYNEALTRTSENMLQTVMQQRQQAQQESQFVRSLAQDQSQFDESMTEQRKAGALRRLQFMAPFMVGQSIAANPMAASDMGVLYRDQGMSPDDFMNPEGLGGMKFGDETFDQYWQEQMIGTFESLPEDMQNELRDRGLSLATTGQAVRGSQLEAQGDLFDLQWNNAQQLMQDPKVLEEMTRGFLGVEQPIEVQFGNKTFRWDNTAEAGIAMRLMEMSFARDQLRAGSGQAFAQVTGDLADDLTEFARDNKIGISKGIARSIVQAYHSEPPEGMSKDQQLAQLREDLSPEGQAAMQLYVNGVSMTPQIEEYLEQTAPGALTYMQLSAYADQVGLTSEQKNSLVPMMARGMAQSGINISHTRRRPWESWNVNPGGVTPGGEEGAGPTNENLFEQMKSDARRLANGEVSMKEISEKYEQEQANHIFNAASAAMQGGGNR